jgi:starch synthase
MDAAIDLANPATRPVKRPTRRGRVARPAPPPALAPLRRANDETIVHLSSEYLPYAQTGGLAEAVCGVATEQARSGRRAVVFLPFYRAVRLGFPRVEPVGEGFEVRLGARTEVARVHRDPTTGPGRPEILFVEVGELFDRSSIYGEDGGYPDNHLRFGFFCAAALAWMREVVPEPSVLHPHDWHAALAPFFLRKRLAGDSYYDRIGTVLTVHNAGYQGRFGPEAWAELGLDDPATRAELGDWHGDVNFLGAGLRCADVVTTVSPSHAAELLTPLGGFGLHELFRGLGDRLIGVLNGIDYSIWDPQTDPWIESNYGPSDFSGKAECKRWLQRHLGLEVRADLPLFAMTSRLAEQKGIDLLLGGDLLSRVEAQWVFLGEGEQRYRDALQRRADSAPRRISCNFAFRPELEHKVIAGADYLLMPSLYEPCGLTQMRAQRYGTVPLVRKVGGLSDTVVDGVTGIVFDAYEPAALETAVLRAVESHRNGGEWERMARAGMGRDFSFTRGAKEYAHAYARAATARRGDADPHMP